VGEDRGRDEPVVGGEQIVGVQQVVGDDPGLVVGDVLELELRADVAERPDAVGGGALVLVDDDAAVGVQVDAGRLRVQQFGARDAAWAVEPSSRVTWMPSASSATPATVCPSRTSQFSAARVVKAAATSASRRRSSVAVRAISVVGAPKEEKTCANSAAM
jgi:hypothetical protein